MNDKHQDEARESLFAVVGEIGGVWATFDTREKAEGYPGPRMLECAARTIVEYVPASLLLSRDQQIREVLEGLSAVLHVPNGEPQRCWCHRDMTWTHSPACLAAQALWIKVNPDSTSDTSGSKVQE